MITVTNYEIQSMSKQVYVKVYIFKYFSKLECSKLSMEFINILLKNHNLKKTFSQKLQSLKENILAFVIEWNLPCLINKALLKQTTFIFNI